MGITRAWPELHGATGLLTYPLTEVLIGHEEDVAISRHFADNFHGVPACANYIRECFDCSRAIDVGNDVNIGMGLFVGR